MKIELDLRKTIAENAADCYTKSKKAKGKISGAEEASEKTQEKIFHIKERGLGEKEKQVTKAPVKKRKKQWFENFRFFTSSDGFLVVGGRDATSNEILIKKHTDSRDKVFHADIKGGAFFVVKNPDSVTVPETTLLEAARAAASYSSGWKAGLGSADVYLVEPSQLSKTPESGEYLTKGAFVVRGERTWFKNTPLEIAVGFDPGKNEVIGGPKTAVSAKTSYYVIMVPGQIKSAQLAREVKKALARKTTKEAGLALKKKPLDDIQKVVAAGGGSIIE